MPASVTPTAATPQGDEPGALIGPFCLTAQRHPLAAMLDPPVADGFAVDASLIAADANKQRSVPSDEWKAEEVKEKAR